jgi:hypothetical protein
MTTSPGMESIEQRSAEPPKDLTASEAAYTWLSCMADGMACRSLSYCVKVAEDTQIKEVLEYAVHLSERHVERAEAFLTEAGHPKPHGFTDEDVNLGAPRLFSDAFVLLHLYYMGGMGMTVYSKAISSVTRSDIHQFYMEALVSSAELCSRTKKLLLEKGLYVRPPYISPQDRVDVVKRQQFLAGLLGDIRPMTAIEVSNMFFNLQTIEVVKTLMVAFSQVARSADVRDMFIRGKMICNKHSDRLLKVFREEDVPAALPHDLFVTSSTVAPFSDKLMMFWSALLIGGGFEQYAFSLTTTIRRDIGLRYNEFLVEMQKFSEDAAELMIKHEWLEQPPLVADREELSGVK